MRGHTDVTKEPSARREKFPDDPRDSGNGESKDFFKKKKRMTREIKSDEGAEARKDRGRSVRGDVNKGELSSFLSNFSL